MRTKRQSRYDKLYYGFELWLTNIFRNMRARRFIRGTRFDKDFTRAFREEVRPYWQRFGVNVSPLWFKFYYKITGQVDKRFIPDTIHHRYIVPYFDDPAYERSMEDKNLYNLLFPDVRRPETVFKHFAATDFNTASSTFCEDDFLPITRGEALLRLLSGGRFIIKPTRDTSEGTAVRVFSSEDGRESITALLDSYDGIDYIVQRVIVQHEDLAAFNASSVNTVRIVTLVFRDEPHILSAILRIGHSGSMVDNIGAGGYQASIRPDGTLRKYAMMHTKDGGYDVHAEAADNGLRFEGYRIPAWDKLCQTAKNAALRLPHLKIIGWDFSVGTDGEPILIEINCHFGQNQENCGPTFGDLTDEVLGEVFKQ